MVESIGIFILFLCPLVFFHELGHFFFARLFGVKVEVFSLGFGPKLLKFKKGDTQYAFSLIPLGGYVKMYGEDILAQHEIPEELRRISFCYKNKWQRFWIAFGGPLANFIFAFILFFGLSLSGERLPEFKLGIVGSGDSFYEMGFRTGDVLKRVNGKVLNGPTDFPAGEDVIIKNVSIKRFEKEKTISVNRSAEDFFKGISKYSPFLRDSTLVNSNGDKYVLSKSSTDFNAKLSLDQLISINKKLFIFKQNIDQSKRKPREFIEASVSRKELLKELVDKGYYPQGLVVKSVKMDSAADVSGLKSGDILYKLDGKNVYSFEELRNGLQDIDKKKISLSIFRKGNSLNIVIEPRLEEVEGKAVKLIGVFSSVNYLMPNFFTTESKGFVASIIFAGNKTVDTIVKTYIGFKKLISGGVSRKNIGGPIAIGKVATDSFNTSMAYFFQIMAMISVNLGLINLFPIPVLDGGHIMFILFEVINRGPLSRRKMEIAQQVGLSIILLLMFTALFNDFSRFF